jgi:hypothetical protein
MREEVEKKISALGIHYLSDMSDIVCLASTTLLLLYYHSILECGEGGGVRRGTEWVGVHPADQQPQHGPLTPRNWFEDGCLAEWVVKDNKIGRTAARTKM